MKSGKAEGIKQGVTQGIKQGISRGIEQGITQGIEQVALNMLKQNIDIDIISKSTGLSIANIKKLQIK